MAQTVACNGRFTDYPVRVQGQDHNTSRDSPTPIALEMLFPSQFLTDRQPLLIAAALLYLFQTLKKAFSFVLRNLALTLTLDIPLDETEVQPLTNDGLLGVPMQVPLTQLLIQAVFQ